MSSYSNHKEWNVTKNKILEDFKFNYKECNISFLYHALDLAYEYGFINGVYCFQNSNENTNEVI